MGTTYYLARPDSGTLFDLGKSYEAARTWRGEVDRFTTVVVDTSTGALAKVLRTGMGFEAETPYLCEVIRRIRRFADGREVHLLDEHDLEDDAFRGEGGELRVTGSRFDDG